MVLKEYIGLKVLVYLNERVEGIDEIEGILKDVDKENIQILTNDNKVYFIPFSSIRFIIYVEK